MKHLPILALLLASPAFAETETRPETQCKPFYEAVEALDEFRDIDADRRDVVDIRPRPRFDVEDGIALPTRAFFRKGDEVRELTITAEGAVDGVFEAARELGPSAEMCVTDPHYAGTPTSEPGRAFYVGLIPEYLDLDGALTLAELEEGADDGRKYFKKMAPGIVSFMVPKLDHIMVSHPFDDGTALPRVFALKGGAELGEVDMERLEDTQLLALDTLEDMGADAIRIEGDYRLYPMPDAKTIRRYMN